MPTSELLSGTAVCMAVAAYWREWQPTPLGAVPQSSGAGTLLEHYVFSPAEAAFSVADVMGSMAARRASIAPTSSLTASPLLASAMSRPASCASLIMSESQRRGGAPARQEAAPRWWWRAY